MPSDQRHQSELLAAVRANDVASARRLLDSWLTPPPARLPCMPYPRPGSLCSAVLAASALPEPTLLELLLHSGASVDFTAETQSLVAGTRVTPLHVATSNGLHDVMETLIGANASINRSDSQGRAPLHIAAWRCDVTGVRLLLHHGADVTAVTSRGETSLQLSSRYGHVELVRVLLERGAAVFQQGQRGDSPLHVAAAEGHVPLIDMFCRYVDVNVKSAGSSEQTALHVASTHGMLETVRFMVERHGADVNSLDWQQQTCLHRTISRRHSPRCARNQRDFELTCEFLLTRGVHVNQQDEAGQTALHLAARHQFPVVVEALFVNGVDARLLDKMGKTARQYVPDYDVQTRRLFEQYANFAYLALSKSPQRLRGTPDLLPQHAQPKVQPETKPDSETISKFNTETETDSKAEGEMETKAECEKETKVVTKTKPKAATKSRVGANAKQTGSEVFIDGDVTVICTNENAAPRSCVPEAAPNNMPVKIMFGNCQRLCKDKVVLNDGRTIFRNVHSPS